MKSIVNYKTNQSERAFKSQSFVVGYMNPYSLLSFVKCIIFCYIQQAYILYRNHITPPHNGQAVCGDHRPNALPDWTSWMEWELTWRP